MWTARWSVSFNIPLPVFEEFYESIGQALFDPVVGDCFVEVKRLGYVQGFTSLDSLNS